MIAQTHLIAKAVKSTFPDLLSFIDLFSGVGGFRYGMHPFGRCVFASEYEKNARKTYEKNWGTELARNNAQFAGDITKVNYRGSP